jgi:hypothetical protein
LLGGGVIETVYRDGIDVNKWLYDRVNNG